MRHKTLLYPDVAFNSRQRPMLQQETEATDAQIDRLVYDLYGLTEEEIKLVEGAA